mgnify:FL=1
MENWWNSNKDAHEGVMDRYEAILEKQDYRKDQNLQNLRLYGNYYNSGLSSSTYARTENTSIRHRVTLNVIQSMCDTVTAKIAKNRPKATFLTSDGDYRMQRRAKLLDKFCEGQFYATKIYDIAPRVFLDACVFGTGAMKIYEGQEKIEVERVFPNEIVVDDKESVYGSPRQLFQVKYVDRDVLHAIYPERRDEIYSAAPPEGEYGEGDGSSQILCVEAWHLPSGKDAGDGRHAICIDGATLLEEPYERPYFPFVFIRWTERLLGFYGQGLAEQLTGIQLEINKLLFNIQEQMHLAKPKVFVEAGSKIAKAHLNNETWGVIEYRGTPPQFFVPRTVSGEIFSHLDRLFNRAYEITGISQLAAQSKKPAGLESGVALREFQDIETERFMITAQQYERVFLDAARQMIDIAREAAERGDNFEVISHGDKFIEKIKWKDINLKDDQYVMKIYPTNLLPTTPAGKLQKVIEMLQAGMLSQQEARGLLDYPDIAAVNNMAMAAYDDVMQQIEQMLEHGIYSPPEPFTDLPLAMRLVRSAYLKAKVNKVPEERQDLLRRFLEDCVSLIGRMQAEAQRAQAEAQAPAPGMGAPEGMAAPTGATPAAMSEQMMAEEAAAPQGAEQAIPM